MAKSIEEVREQNRIYQKSKRQRLGATPREESKAVTRPWELEGVSRATWYRTHFKQEASHG